MDAVTVDRAKTALERALYADPDLYAYAVVDGAQNPELPAILSRRKAGHHCLFVGDLDREVAAVAPYLVPLPEDSDLLDFLFHEGWGRRWAIYLTSPRKILDLRKHMRTLTLAEMPDGETVFFRFYDPSALRSILPLLTDHQRSLFFGREAVASFYCEGEDPGEVLQFPAG
ncbi:MAG: DUF4123 domain-containing protein [Pseudomonadota bacterium]